MRNIFWCKKCNAPILTVKCKACNTQGFRIASDIRPVFPEEKMLLEVLLQFPQGYLSKKSVWYTSGNMLLIDGKTQPLNKSELEQLDISKIRKELFHRKSNFNLNYEYSFFDSHIRSFIMCNRERVNEIEFEAFEIVEKAKNLEKDFVPIVSFSGGKDSTVVSDIVRRAYANQSIIHAFGNTTLELPETLEYISRFKKNNNKTPFIESKSKHNFINVCEKIGPPSRVMRWCCTVFKTGPIGQTFSGLSATKPILTYYGVRRSESSRRSKYKSIEKSPKISQQTVVAPIINWNNVDIWLYILERNLDFNHSYRLGFSRVGCWACPSNSSWSFFLTRIYHPELSEPWRKFLIGVAREIGKPDPIEYVDSGNWKARQGGMGLENSYKGIITSKPCGDDPFAKTYQLTKPIESGLYEYFKPFGTISFTKGRSILGEVFVLDKKTEDPIIILQGRPGASELRVKIVSSNNPTLLMQRIDCQIRKYQSCILCGGCPSICPTKAISVTTGKYRIDEKKCISCLKCIANFDTGCLVSKVLKTKKGENK